MKNLKEYITEELLNEDIAAGGYWAEFDNKIYYLCKCQLKDLKKIDFKDDMPIGTLIQAYGVKEYINKYEGYCRFEKQDKDKWKLTKYTPGLVMSDNNWIESDETSELSSNDVKNFAIDSKSAKTIYTIFIPQINRKGNLIGVTKYFNGPEPDMYIPTEEEFYATSFVKLIDVIDNHKQWNDVDILRIISTNYIIFRYHKKRDIYTMFIMTPNELNKALRSKGYEYTGSNSLKKK